MLVLKLVLGLSQCLNSKIKTLGLLHDVVTKPLICLVSQIEYLASALRQPSAC